jgi:hypothetical protein
MILQFMTRITIMLHDVVHAEYVLRFQQNVIL